MRKQLSNFVALSAVNVFVRLTGLLVFPVIAKSFSLPVFGMYILAQTVWTYFSTFSDMGVKSVAVRDLNILPDGLFKKRFVAQVISLRVLTCAGSFLLMNIVGLLLAPDSLTRVLIHLFSLSILPLCLDMTWFFDARQDMSRQILYRMGERVVFLTLVLFGAAVKNIYVVAFAGFISTLAAGAGLLLLHKEFWAYGRIRFEKKQWNIFREAVVIGVSGLLTPLLLTVDLFFVNYYLPKEMVAMYGGYEKIITAILSFGWVFAYALYPELSRRYGRADRAGIIRLLLRANALIAAAFVVLFVAYIPAARWVVRTIFTADFVRGIAALHILMGVAFLSVVNSLLLSGLNAFTLTRQRLYVTALGLIFTVICCAAFVPRWGIVGAAVASVVSHAVVTLAAALILRARIASLSGLADNGKTAHEKIIPALA